MLGSRALDPVIPNLLFSITQIVLHVCLPQLLVQLVCKEMGLTGLECDSAAVSGQASMVSLYSSVLIAVPGLFIVGFYGKFADYYGLKMTLLCPVVGNLLFLACMYWALLYPDNYFNILMLGSVISGFRSVSHLLHPSSHAQNRSFLEFSCCPGLLSSPPGSPALRLSGSPALRLSGSPAFLFSTFPCLR